MSKKIKGNISKGSSSSFKITKNKIKGNCGTCYGYGMWTDGTAPMGPMDSEDGMPTIECPECKANANPIKPVRDLVDRMEKTKK